MPKSAIKNIAVNRKARFDYFIVDQYEAGLVLKGTEVKSLRLGKANLKDAYARVINGEVYVYQLHIGPYPFAYYENHDPLRVRKLLLHKREILKLNQQIREKGLTIIPIRLFINDKGLAKLEIALAKGKKLHDKKNSIKAKDIERDIEREIND